ncbi:VOC family protein, partial [Streptomyces sp. NPDC048248]|uniref:VOC family protein n=1 Tax=Streptomyces sp. NPDC048248 TaxID=3365523 RepID=UPI00371916D2
LRGGAVEAAPDPHVRPRWNMHIQVSDLAEASAAALAAGGTVIPATPVHGIAGDQAVIRDPNGALFTVTDCASSAGQRPPAQ